MKFGIIGTGMIAHIHAQAIRKLEGSHLVAFYGRNEEKLEALTEAHDCKGYTDLNAFLKHSELEIVTIATASGAHMELCIEAAKAGKHVICEKPLEITMDRVNYMIEVCHNFNVTLAGIFNRRYNPAFRHLQSAVLRERFGRIALASAYIKWYRDDAYYASANWRGTWDLDGGGALMNQSIHTIDQLLTLAGPVKMLSATMGTLTHHEIEVEDTAVASLEFSSGARGTIEGSTSCWSENGFPAEIHICGEKGSVVMTDDRFRNWEFKNEEAMDSEIRDCLMIGSNNAAQGGKDPKAINTEGHRLNFQDVICAIRDDRLPEISGIEARKPVALINQIYASAKNKSVPVLMDE